MAQIKRFEKKKKNTSSEYNVHGEWQPQTLDVASAGPRVHGIRLGLSLGLTLGLNLGLSFFGPRGLGFRV